MDGDDPGENDLLLAGFAEFGVGFPVCANRPVAPRLIAIAAVQAAFAIPHRPVISRFRMVNRWAVFRPVDFAEYEDHPEGAKSPPKE